MKFYIPFGDWSDDGHGKYENLLVEAPSMEGLLKAQEKIKERYGKDFFSHIADEYEDSSIGDDVYEALKDTGYSLKRFLKVQGIDQDLFSSWREYKNDEASSYISLRAIQDIFVWLLNAYGAKIEVMEEIPQINNWTCRGFEAVGYGCFD